MLENFSQQEINALILGAFWLPCSVFVVFQWFERFSWEKTISCKYLLPNFLAVSTILAPVAAAVILWDNWRTRRR